MQEPMDVHCVGSGGNAPFTVYAADGLRVYEHAGMAATSLGWRSTLPSRKLLLSTRPRSYRQCSTCVHASLDTMPVSVHEDILLAGVYCMYTVVPLTHSF